MKQPKKNKTKAGIPRYANPSNTIVNKNKNTPIRVNSKDDPRYIAYDDEGNRYGIHKGKVKQIQSREEYRNKNLRPNGESFALGGNIEPDSPVKNKDKDRTPYDNMLEFFNESNVINVLNTVADNSKNTTTDKAALGGKISKKIRKKLL